MLTACRADQSSPTTDATAVSGSAEQGQPAPAAETASPTPTPPQEIVLCAAAIPDSLIGSSDPVAEAVWALVAPPAAAFGSDYLAEPEDLAAAGGGLLTSLPGTEDGTLRRNPDGTIVVTLHYRDDLVWSDDEPFDVGDALLGLSLPAPAPLGPTYDVISTTLVDDHTLEVTLPIDAAYPYTPPQPPLPAHLLAESATDLVDAGWEAQADALLGTSVGLYRLEAADGPDLTFVLNPTYPDDPPGIQQIQFVFETDTVVLRDMLDSGDCDLLLPTAPGSDTPDELADLAASSMMPTTTIAGLVADRLLINTYTTDSGMPAYFADVRVRQALALAIDRQALADALWGGAVPVMDSWLPVDHWAFPGMGQLTTYQPDLAAAEALLEEAGWQDTDGDGVREYHGPGGTYTCDRGEWTMREGTPLTPQLLIPAEDSLRAVMAEAIVADLAQVGFDVKIVPTPAETLYATDGPLVHRAFGLAILAAVTEPEPDGISNWVGIDVYRHPLSGEAVTRDGLEERWLDVEQEVERLAYDNTPQVANAYEGQNYSGWCNEDASLALVKATLIDLDVEQRAARYAQQQAIFTANLPALPLFARPQTITASPTLCGLDPGPWSPITWNVATWSVDETGACADGS